MIYNCITVMRRNMPHILTGSSFPNDDYESYAVSGLCVHNIFVNRQRGATDLSSTSLRSTFLATNYPWCKANDIRQKKSKQFGANIHLSFRPSSSARLKYFKSTYSFLTYLTLQTYWNNKLQCNQNFLKFPDMIRDLYALQMYVL